MNSATLTPSQRSELESALKSLEQELESQIAAAGENVKPVSLDSPIGRVTRIDAVQQQKMAQANLSLNKEKLKAVLRAQNSLRLGNYGTCIECEEFIGVARLKAKPETLWCRDCQEDRERG